MTSGSLSLAHLWLEFCHEINVDLLNYHLKTLLTPAQTEQYSKQDSERLCLSDILSIVSLGFITKIYLPFFMEVETDPLP